MSWEQGYPVTLGHEYVGTVVSVGNDEDQERLVKPGCLSGSSVYGNVPYRIGQYAQCESYKTWVPEQTAALPYCLLPSRKHLVFPMKIQGFPERWHWACSSHTIRKGDQKAGIRQ